MKTYTDIHIRKRFREEFLAVAARDRAYMLATAKGTSQYQLRRSVVVSDARNFLDGIRFGLQRYVPFYTAMSILQEAIESGEDDEAIQSKAEKAYKAWRSIW